MNKTPDRRKLLGAKDRTPTGAWRERFRKGCLQRLKDKRYDMMKNLRDAGDVSSNESPQSSQESLSQLMADEWEKMKLESPTLRNLPQFTCKNESFEFEDGDDDDNNRINIDEILNVFEDIQQELIREEQRMLSEYEDVVQFDEGHLCAAIDLLSTDSVLCPVCKRHNLLQNDRVIFCACGFRIDTEQDAINLRYVQNQIKDAISSHSATCTTEPEFGVIDLTGINMKNLMMTCQACDCMVIIV